MTIEFNIVERKKYEAEIKISNAYSNLIKTLEQMKGTEAIILDAEKKEIQRIMAAISHYFGNGVYGYKTVKDEQRIIYKKEGK